MYINYERKMLKKLGGKKKKPKMKRKKKGEINQ